MKRILLALAFLSSVQLFGSITIVQHTLVGSQKVCSAGVCPALTVTTTGSGHSGVFGISSSIAGNKISTISCGGVSCPGWQVSHTSPICSGTDATGDAATDIAYYPALPSGITSITVTFTSATTDSAADMEFVELSSTLGTMSFDACGNRTNSPASANYAGVTLTLGGSNDYILQVGRPATGMTACSSGWSPCDLLSGDGYASKANTASGTAITWTVTSSTAALSALAMQESAGGGPTAFGVNKRQKLDLLEAVPR